MLSDLFNFLINKIGEDIALLIQLPQIPKMKIHIFIPKFINNKSFSLAGS